jgi:HAD superfamily hydrolase (TIGR01509 family)
MIDAVLFDLGDTIIDFGVGRREAEVLFRQGAKLTYQDLLARNTPNLPSFLVYARTHYRIMQRAYIWSKFCGRDFSYETIQARAAYKLNLAFTPDDLHRLAILWYHPVALASAVDPGVLPMLRALRDSGLSLGIVSNTVVPPHCLDAHLAAEKLLEFFPIRVYSSQVRYRKPHPRIFQIALNLIGVPPARTLFIGDLLKADVSGAKKAGMHTVWKPARKFLHNGIVPPLPRRHHADHTIPHVTHLPQVLHKYGWRPTHQAALDEFMA